MRSKISTMLTIAWMTLSVVYTFEVGKDCLKLFFVARFTFENSRFFLCFHLFTILRIQSLVTRIILSSIRSQFASVGVGTFCFATIFWPSGPHRVTISGASVSNAVGWNGFLAKGSCLTNCHGLVGIGISSLRVYWMESCVCLKCENNNWKTQKTHAENNLFQKIVY